MLQEKLESLLELWQKERDRGIELTAEDLCRDVPELTATLSNRIRVLLRFDQLLDLPFSETLVSQADVDTSSDADPPGTPNRKPPARMPASIGGFTPIEILGVGGMGAVFLCEDRKLGRRVAVKVMKDELATNVDARQRFLREASAMATIEHDNIITIYGVGEDGTIPFLVMPVLKGETLEDRLHRERQLSVPECCRVGIEISEGLSAAHAQGLIHRDVKPSNIWLEGKSGRVRLLDFGLARAVAADQRVTQSGAVLGTPAYMAPEQAAGLEATLQSDLFSLGVVMYLMATGIQPFAGANVIATLSNLASREPLPAIALDSSIPQALSDLIDQLICKSPAGRPASARLVSEELQKILSGTQQHGLTSTRAIQPDSTSCLPLPETLETPKQPRRRPVGKVLTVALGVLVAVVFAGMIYRIQTDRGTILLVLEDEQIEARLGKNGLTLEDARSGRKWNIMPELPEVLPSGAYRIPDAEGLKLVVRDDSGAETLTREFSIRRGEAIRVQVTLESRQGTPVAGGNGTTASTQQAKKTIASSMQPVEGESGTSEKRPSIAVSPFNSNQAKQQQQAWANFLGVPIEYTNSLGMKFVLIPPGEFLMGTLPEDVDTVKAVARSRGGEYVEEAITTSSPPQPVRLSEPVYLGVHEVTQSQYAAVMKENPSAVSATGRLKELITKDGTESLPVESVKVEQANAFCFHLSVLEGLDPCSLEWPLPLAGDGYRLPSEALWEFAARAGSITRFSYGVSHDAVPQGGWFAENSEGRPHPVGGNLANPFGLHDMHGNISEWLSDGWSPESHRDESSVPEMQIDPVRPFVDEAYVITRGGSWAEPGLAASSPFRVVLPTYFANAANGFRVCLSVDGVRRRLGLAPPDPHTKDREAVQTLLKEGASCSILLKGKIISVSSPNDIPDAPFSLNGITFVRNYAPGDTDLSMLAACENLTHFYCLGKQSINNNSFATDLSGSRLNVVLLAGLPYLTDEGLRPFGALSQLRDLALAELPISDAGLAHFRNGPGLRNISLGGLNVSDVGLRAMPLAPRMSGINIENCPNISPEGLSHFRQCLHVHYIGLSGPQFDDSSLVHLENFKKSAGVLNLQGTSITDASVDLLIAFRNVGSMNLCKTKISEAVVKQLAIGLPKCRIEWDGGIVEPSQE